MVKNNLITTNYFPVADETYTGNLSGSILANATTVPIINLTQYADGDIVVLTVEPGTSNQATVIGVKQSTPTRLVSCVWTEGNTTADHASGATVIDYDSATHYDAVTKGIRQFANNDGTLKTTAVQAALNISSAVPPDWTALSITPTVTNSYGQREYKLTFPGVDYRDRLQLGTKLRIPRSVAPPTQSAQFTAASSQYAAKTSPAGLTFTDNFTVEAQITLDGYVPTQDTTIYSRYNGTIGFILYLNQVGQVVIGGYSTSTSRSATSIQSIPLGKKVHVAASLNMAGNIGKIYIDGVDVPVTMLGAATSLLQSPNDVRIASYNTGAYWNGKISDIRLWNVVRTPAQIRDNANQQLVGNEANLIAYYKLNGDFNDSTINANNMTSSGGAIATLVYSPFNAIEFGVITGIALVSGNTEVIVYTGQSSTIPNAALSAVSYSTAKAPYGFPSDVLNWEVQAVYRQRLDTAIGGINTWWYSAGGKLTIPSGKWEFIKDGVFHLFSSTSGPRNGAVASNVPGSESILVNGAKTFNTAVRILANGTTDAIITARRTTTANNSTQVQTALGATIDNATGTENWAYSTDGAPTILTARCPYI